MWERASPLPASDPMQSRPRLSYAATAHSQYILQQLQSVSICIGLWYIDRRCAQARWWHSRKQSANFPLGESGANTTCNFYSTSSLTFLTRCFTNNKILFPFPSRQVNCILGGCSSARLYSVLAGENEAGVSGAGSQSVSQLSQMDVLECQHSYAVCLIALVLKHLVIHTVIILRKGFRRGQ